MALQPELLCRLDQIAGRSITLRELAWRPKQKAAVGLRHDVDHDLDLALELAAAENQRSLRATYFLLHTAGYWGEEGFDQKVRQLTAYGHEVGLHVNVLTEWLDGSINHVAVSLAENLQRLRDSGARVVGASAHGDKRCYVDGYINYWIWQELRRWRPASRESGLSAEGIPTDDPERQIPYPKRHRLKRADGRSLRLWSVSQRKHGIEYEAAKIPVDRYWTDTGGTWRRGDPFEADLDVGRHQILIHPWWWRAPPRAIFGLTADHAGSRWFADVIHKSSSAASVHNWTLHHDREGNEFPRRPYAAADGIDPSSAEAARLIRAALAHRRLMKRDVVEVSTCLEPFVEILRKQLPEVILIHLHRDGREVVRSLLERGFDPGTNIERLRHGSGEDWSKLSALERACWYFSHTTARLEEVSAMSIALERASAEPDYLAEKLASLGIVVHPVLHAEATHRFDEAENLSVPPFASWSEPERATFDEICRSAQQQLGYSIGPQEPRS